MVERVLLRVAECFGQRGLAGGGAVVPRLSGEGRECVLGSSSGQEAEGGREM